MQLLKDDRFMKRLSIFFQKSFFSHIRSPRVFTNTRVNLLSPAACLLALIFGVCNICAMDADRTKAECPSLNDIEFSPIPPNDSRAVTVCGQNKTPLEDAALHRQLNPTDWDGSCEQACGFWTCGCLSFAGIAYVCARLTPSNFSGLLNTGTMYPQPVTFNGFFGPNELPPEQELLGTTIPFAAALFCASHTESDYHSCLLGNVRAAGRKIRYAFSNNRPPTIFDPDASQDDIFTHLKNSKKTE